jgi:ribosomal 50S subunit-recycling heat shock protein
VRLDKFLQVSRLVKRREVANRLCDHGRVRLNGAPAKPSAAVRPGDVITISQGDRRLVARVVAVPERPAPSPALVEILARTDIRDWHA